MQFLTILAILLLILIAAIFAQNPPIRRNNLPQTRPQPRPPPRPMARRPFRPSRPSQFVAVRRPAAAAIVVPLKKQKQFSPESVKTVNQCLCADIRPCKEKYMSALGPCLDSCQNIVKPLGGDLKQIWQCFKQREGMLKATISCTENKYENACAKSTGFTVPQRYKQNLQNMATAEIDKMITKMGLQKEARPFLSTGKKLFECVKNCMNKRSGSCEKSLNCGLALPSDRALVESAKQCAMQGGVNTANAQQLCRCALAAGVKNLNDNLCSRIIIS